MQTEIFYIVWSKELKREKPGFLSFCIRLLVFPGIKVHCEDELNAKLSIAL